MDENSSTSLLLSKNEKVHFHDCPGCQTDRLKQTNTGIPYKFLSYIWLVSLCTALPTSSLYPFVYFMIRDFHIAIREEDIGYYAGILGSSFMVGRALTSVLWGILADRYGRKPIVLVGTLSVFIFNTLFGLSTNFWMALSMRFLLGCFNSLLGTIRHMDAYVYMLNKRMKESDTYNEKLTLVDTTFAQSLKSDWKLYKAGKWKTWDDHDIPVVYFWAETGYSNPFLNVDNVLCPTNIDNNHWVLVRLDLVSQCVHVYSSTKPIGYEKKFQYMA